MGRTPYHERGFFFGRSPCSRALPSSPQLFLALPTSTRPGGPAKKKKTFVIGSPAQKKTSVCYCLVAQFTMVSGRTQAPSICYCLWAQLTIVSGRAQDPSICYCLLIQLTIVSGRTQAPSICYCLLAQLTIVSGRTQAPLNWLLWFRVAISI